MAKTINNFTAIANLVADPEQRAASTGNHYATFRFATNYGSREKGEQFFARAIVFGKSADYVMQYLAKGARVYLAGRLRTNSFEKDGVKMSSTELVVNEVAAVDSRQDAGQDGQAGGYQEPSAQGYSEPQGYAAEPPPPPMPRGGSNRPMSNYEFGTRSDNGATNDIPF